MYVTSFMQVRSCVTRLLRQEEWVISFKVPAKPDLSITSGQWHLIYLKSVAIDCLSLYGISSSGIYSSFATAVAELPCCQRTEPKIVACGNSHVLCQHCLRSARYFGAFLRSISKVHSLNKLLATALSSFPITGSLL